MFEILKFIYSKKVMQKYKPQILICTFLLYTSKIKFTLPNNMKLGNEPTNSYIKENTTNRQGWFVFPITKFTNKLSADPNNNVLDRF